MRIDRQQWQIRLAAPNHTRVREDGSQRRPSHRAEDDLMHDEAPGLHRLVTHFLKLILDKSKAVRCSDWPQPLTPAQVQCKFLLLFSFGFVLICF